MIGFQYSTILKFVRTLEASRWFRAKANAFNQMAVPPEDTGLLNEDPNVVAARQLFNEEKEMWVVFFDMCIRYLKCPSLSKEKLSLLFLERYGDLRNPMCVVMRRTWKTFFTRKFHLFPDVVRNFLLLADTPHDMIKTNAMECYFMTLCFDFEMNKNMNMVKKLTMDFLEKERLSDSFESFFFTEIQNKVNAVPQLKQQDPLYDVRTFYSHIKRLNMIPRNLDMLDTRISAMHELLDFLRDRGYLELYEKYLGFLYKLFDEYKNPECFGHSLLLQADLYKWEDYKPLPQSANDARMLPAKIVASQPACLRREHLYVMAAEKLEEGGAFESAYAVLQDAKKFNAEQEYNIDEICAVLNLQARVAKALSEKEGIPPEYYRVGFFGSDVDESIRNKEFIYLAHPLEKLGDFQERLEKQYPGCEFLKKTDYPSSDVTDAPGLKILVTPVKPCTLEEADPKNAKKLPSIDPANPTQLPSNVEIPRPATSVFLYSKPFRKVERQKGENEFVGLYLQKLFFYVQDAFPSSRCRSVVTKREEIEVSPLQNAINTVRDKTEEFKSLVAKHKANPELNPQPLIMLLNGVICAAVNGGTWMYKEAFLGDDYRTAHPEDVPKCDFLLSSIIEQIRSLDEGMVVLDELCHMEQNQSMLNLLEVMKEQQQDSRKKWIPSTD